MDEGGQEEEEEEEEQGKEEAEAAQAAPAGRPDGAWLSLCVFLSLLEPATTRYAIFSSSCHRDRTHTQRWPPQSPGTHEILTIR